MFEVSISSFSESDVGQEQTYLVLEHVSKLAEAAPALDGMREVEAVGAPEVLQQRHDALWQVVVAAEVVDFPLHIRQTVPVALRLPPLHVQLIYPSSTKLLQPQSHIKSRHSRSQHAVAQVLSHTTAQ